MKSDNSCRKNSVAKCMFGFSSDPVANFILGSVSHPVDPTHSMCVVKVTRSALIRAYMHYTFIKQ